MPLIYDREDPEQPYDHYCRFGDEPCETREPSGQIYVGEVHTPVDASIQCRTCRWAPRCFAAEVYGAVVNFDTLDVDVRPLPAGEDAALERLVDLELSICDFPKR